MIAELTLGALENGAAAGAARSNSAQPRQKLTCHVEGFTSCQRSSRNSAVHSCRLTRNETSLLWLIRT